MPSVHSDNSLITARQQRGKDWRCASISSLTRSNATPSCIKDLDAIDRCRIWELGARTEARPETPTRIDFIVKCRKCGGCCKDMKFPGHDINTIITGLAFSGGACGHLDLPFGKMPGRRSADINDLRSISTDLLICSSPYRRIYLPSYLLTYLVAFPLIYFYSQTKYLLPDKVPSFELPHCKFGVAYGTALGLRTGQKKNKGKKKTKFPISNSCWIRSALVLA